MGGAGGWSTVVPFPIVPSATTQSLNSRGLTSTLQRTRVRVTQGSSFESTVGAWPSLALLMTTTITIIGDFLEFQTT